MKKYCFLVATSLLLPGCTNSADQMPLVYARTQTFGATVGATAPDQGAQITVGFGDRNLAVVPTTTRDGKEIRGVIKGKSDGTEHDTSDSLSVLGQFEAGAAPGAAGINLGTFFSTGQAASKLSDGFAAKLGYKEPGSAPEAKPAQ